MNNTRDEIFIKNFGERVKQLRISKGMSQEQLMLEAEVGKNQIGLIERGEVNSTISTVNALAKALEIEPFELLKF